MTELKGISSNNIVLVDFKGGEEDWESGVGTPRSESTENLMIKVHVNERILLALND